MTIFAVMCGGHVPADPRRAGPGWRTGSRPTRTRWRCGRTSVHRAAVGRVRGEHLLHRVTHVLVHGHDPGPWPPLRDRSKTRIRQALYGFFSLGWTGSARHWHRYEKAYLLLAALATPLVLSVHSVVSFDFAVAQLPGWHTTDLPPVLRGRCDFRRFRDGGDAGSARPAILRPQRDHQPAAHREHEQGDPGHGNDRRLRLHDRAVSPPGTAATPTSNSPS